MSSVWGKNIKLSLFGESHGSAVGITIDGLKAGLELDFELINSDLWRRAPGKDEISTKRSEKDAPEIISGVTGGKTNGFPLCVLFKNEDTKSGDYNTDIMRPGHADLTAFYKHQGFADMRGGGHFSGRLTAGLVFAGAVAKQVLAKEGIEVGARIYSVLNIKDERTDAQGIIKLSKLPFPSNENQQKMKEKILEAGAIGDSVGGIVECAVTGIPPSLGSPFFDSCESVISSLLFSIPAVKGVEFGDGFTLAGSYGSQANDEIRIKDGKIFHNSNHNGGIVGGITNGEPLIFRTAIKPTPSISTEQNTINIKTMENTIIKVKGRHDPCIVPRAAVVIEAAAAIAILDLMS